MTDLFDTIVLELYEAALTDIGEAGPHGLATQVALVPHGGYGRRDVAPFSDVDLMILHTPAAARRVAPLAERMVRRPFRRRFAPGPKRAHRARRLHAGPAGRHDLHVVDRVPLPRRQRRAVHPVRPPFRTANAPPGPSFDRGNRRVRHEERGQYGETVYLLEPNIKRSQGGLRDVQLLRWVGFARTA